MGGWGGREHGADGSLARMGVWRGRDSRESGADRRLGRMGAWRGREAGAKGSTGLKGGWGGRQPTAEGSMGFDPQATTFLSPPGGIYLIRLVELPVDSVYSKKLSPVRILNPP